MDEHPLLDDMLAAKLKMLIFVLFLNISRASSRNKNNTFRPRTVLPDHYVKEIRPPSPKGIPVNVDFSIYIVDINSINVEDMDFRVDMFIRQQWTESRLILPSHIFEDGDDYVTFPPQFFDNLWQPDPYFINSKVVATHQRGRRCSSSPSYFEIATLTHKFSSVTLYRNKTVQYSARMHAIIACQMEFRYYPMDIQECPIYIESFSYDSQKVRLRWSDQGVTVNPELKLLQYHFEQPLELDELHTYMAEKGGNYSRLVMYFRFERQIGHHLIQTFAPSALVVVLSWFSFWLGLDAIPGRVTLLVTCMLTLVTMFTGLKSDIPPVAYVKALDLWMAGCMLFVFMALGEFVVVKVLEVRLTEERQAAVFLHHSCSKNTIVTKNMDENNTTEYLHALERKRRNNMVQLSWMTSEGEKILWKEIDRLSCTIFPALFLLFLVIYWPMLLLRKSSSQS